MGVIYNSDELLLRRKKGCERPLIAVCLSDISGEVNYGAVMNKMLSAFNDASIKIDACFFLESQLLDKYTDLTIENIPIISTEILVEYNGNYDLIICDEDILYKFSYKEWYKKVLISLLSFNKKSMKKNLEIARFLKKINQVVNCGNLKKSIKINKNITVKGDIYFFEGFNLNRFLRFYRAEQVKNRSVTFISNNCLAGTFYEWLNLPMNTPTLNLAIKTDDYVKFCMNLEYYLKLELNFSRIEYFELTKEVFPVANLGDIEIQFVHYKSWKEAEKSWRRGCKNIDKERLFFILDEKIYSVSQQNIIDFLNIPYKNKIVFSRKYAQNKEVIFRNDVFDFSETHLVRVEDWFDLIGWINND